MTTGSCERAAPERTAATQPHERLALASARLLIRFAVALELFRLRHAGASRSARLRRRAATLGLRVISRGALLLGVLLHTQASLSEEASAACGGWDYATAPRRV